MTYLGLFIISVVLCQIGYYINSKINQLIEAKKDKSQIANYIPINDELSIHYDRVKGEIYIKSYKDEIVIHKVVKATYKFKPVTLPKEKEYV